MMRKLAFLWLRPQVWRRPHAAIRTRGAHLFELSPASSVTASTERWDDCADLGRRVDRNFLRRPGRDDVETRTMCRDARRNILPEISMTSGRRSVRLLSIPLAFSTNRATQVAARDCSNRNTALSASWIDPLLPAARPVSQWNR
jgi:hypothetical protein